MNRTTARLQKERVMEFTLGELMGLDMAAKNAVNRRLFIGGSDARIIMSPDEAALIRLWKEKRGEAEPEDLSENLIVQLGSPLRRSTGLGGALFRSILSLSLSLARANELRFRGENRCRQPQARSSHRAELMNGSAEFHRRSRSAGWLGGSRPRDQPAVLP